MYLTLINGNTLHKLELFPLYKRNKHSNSNKKLNDMANFETEITIDVLELFYSLPKPKQNKLIKEILSNLDSNELNNLIQNNTVIDKLKYLNKELYTNYKSLDEVDWWHLSMNQTLTESFIRKFSDKVEWFRISRYQILSENFIRDFADKVDWEEISQNQKLSESFIREFQDKVEWYRISHYQTLSEKFIRDFADKVEWSRISKYQKLSKSFRKEFADKLN